jgi:hypothetical protein
MVGLVQSHIRLVQSHVQLVQSHVRLQKHLVWRNTAAIAAGDTDQPWKRS